MVSKDFVLFVAERSGDMTTLRNFLLKSMEELSLVIEASHYCRSVEELKDFLKY